MKNKVTAAITGTAMIVATLSMGACGSREVQYDIECDAGDYTERDSDCGYAPSGVWTYYYWTAPNKTTYAPEGWVPPEEVKHTYKIKTSKKKTTKK